VAGPLSSGVALAALLVSSLAASPTARVDVTRDGALIATARVEVADDADERARGLMGRTDLADDAGMLFVFEGAGRWCFWMRGTPSPLTIAFARADGVVVDVQDMAPFDESLHCPPEPVSLALEVHQGYLARQGAGVGDQLVQRRVRLPMVPALA
jgi:uncharacterized membrane protein (UPF0127 family)